MGVGGFLVIDEMALRQSSESITQSWRFNTEHVVYLNENRRKPAIQAFVDLIPEVFGCSPGA